MIRYVFIYCCLVLFPFSSGAQSTSSPYSFFGIGLIDNRGTGTNHGMGGTGIALKSGISLNPLNPASYSGIDSLSFLFEIGLFIQAGYYETSTRIQKKFDANLRYLSMGFRINSWWSTSFGIMPFSSVGYNINTTDEVEGELSVYNKTFEGNGGINRFYWGHAFKLFNDLSLGMDLSYFKGNLEHSETATNLYNEVLYVLWKSTRLNAVHIDYGLQYSPRLGESRLTLGAVFSGQKSIPGNTDEFIEVNGDTITIDSDIKSFLLPRYYGFGLAFEKGRYLRAAFDYERSEWGEEELFENRTIKLRDSERYMFGLEYTPMKSFRETGMKRMYYRVGASYNKSYMIIDDNPIDSYSLVCGLGIPIRRELSVINLSFEAGRKGTMNDGLILEKYYLLHINFSLHDIWFLRRSID